MTTNQQENPMKDDDDTDRLPRIEEIQRPIREIDVPIKDLTWKDVQGTWEQQGGTTWDGPKGEG